MFSKKDVFFFYNRFILVYSDNASIQRTYIVKKSENISYVFKGFKEMFKGYKDFKIPFDSLYFLNLCQLIIINH